MAEEVFAEAPGRAPQSMAEQEKRSLHRARRDDRGARTDRDFDIAPARFRMDRSPDDALAAAMFDEEPTGAKLGEAAGAAGERSGQVADERGLFGAGRAAENAVVRP